MDDELDREKKRMNSVLGDNLEGLHQNHEKQRSAPHSAQKCVPKTRKRSQLNSVLGENLEDDEQVQFMDTVVFMRTARGSTGAVLGEVVSGALYTGTGRGVPVMRTGAGWRRRE